MKTSERFNNAMKALIKGFFDETLGSGDCGMCAVGNMVAYACNIKVTSSYNRESAPAYEYWYNSVGNICRTSESDLLCETTGYTLWDLILVERAFEANTSIDSAFYNNETKQAIVQDQYNGLMAVVEVLCEIEGIDTKDYKEEFEYILNGDILEKVLS